MRLPCHPLILAAAVLAGCSGASDVREQADRRMPNAGPVAEARAGEAAAVRERTPAVAVERPLPTPLPIDACIDWTTTEILMREAQARHKRVIEKKP